MTSESGDEKEPQRSPGLPSHEEPSMSGGKSRRSIWRKRLTKVLTTFVCVAAAAAAATIIIVVVDAVFVVVAATVIVMLVTVTLCFFCMTLLPDIPFKVYDLKKRIVIFFLLNFLHLDNNNNK